MLAGDLDIGLTLRASEMSRVDVGDGAVDFEALDQEIPEGREDARVDGLVALIVGEKETDLIRG